MGNELDVKKLQQIVEQALEEDVGSGDITTERTIPSGIEIGSYIIARQDGVVAGIPVVESVFRSVDKRLNIKKYVKEGDLVKKDQEIMEIDGFASSILLAERTALNFLSYISGIATLTRRFVDKIKDTGVTLLDTRKTIPIMRFLEKYAVKVGGGMNHRMGLYDQVLIKDNHLRILQQLGTDYVHRAITSSRRDDEGKIEIEVHNLAQAKDAVENGADILLLDNMSIEGIKEVVSLFQGKIPLEASGGVNLDNIEQVAKTGVDYISIGALTHSAPAIDMALEIR